MVDYLPRSAWNAAPAKGGPGALTPSRVKGVVIHWPGSGETDSFDSMPEVAAALRGWQAFHQAPEPKGRGWSDIAYQVAIDQAGRVWDLRGLRTQSGANGNNDLNEEYGAILLVLISGEEPSAEMRASTREVIADFREIYGPDADEIHPHSAVRPDGTTCPGPKARAAIARGDFTPGTDEEDDMSAAQYDALMREIKATRADVRDYALWQVLYELETEDERAQAQAAFDNARAAGKSIQEAKAAAITVLQSLVDGVKKSQQS